MSKAPWGCTPGWDVPRDYFAPDPPDENEENFKETLEERMDMHEALLADGEKLRQLTGEDHGPFILPPETVFVRATIENGLVKVGGVYFAPDEVGGFVSTNPTNPPSEKCIQTSDVPANEDEAQRGLNDTFPGDPYPVAGVLTAIRQRSVQAIHAGISRRDWHATETAANELRDRMDNLIRRLAVSAGHRTTEGGA